MIPLPATRYPHPMHPAKGIPKNMMKSAESSLSCRIKPTPAVIMRISELCVLAFWYI
ncbi:uncharacterized protein BCR38DRAFT_440505 [Pseudomassariella vexata]|uniref:Uncharacterized protein n=1 Tax=Pseudomassariella vexata TaxID=1141098 RepID=A0A1Y2DQW4_9PEZI|nr:uncharacterized protein BCR38DRAFT_440505 [Pseudomassariella vexata]ORY61534.1 hypothetical protein BCR38DRAFT_440505 [Pseudomassariella vexata]